MMTILTAALLQLACQSLVADSLPNTTKYTMLECTASQVTVRADGVILRITEHGDIYEQLSSGAFVLFAD